MAQDNLLDRYNCGPVKFSGGDNALYERHLTFDHVIPVRSAAPRDKFEAIALSIRDVLSQRWLKTEQTYRERNAKRVSKHRRIRQVLQRPHHRRVCEGNLAGEVLPGGVL